MGVFGDYRVKQPLDDTWNSQSILFNEMKTLEKKLNAEAHQGKPGAPSSLRQGRTPKILSPQILSSRPSLRRQNRKHHPHHSEKERQANALTTEAATHQFGEGLFRQPFGATARDWHGIRIRSIRDQAIS